MFADDPLFRVTPYLGGQHVIYSSAEYLSMMGFQRSEIGFQRCEDAWIGIWIPFLESAVSPVKEEQDSTLVPDPATRPLKSLGFREQQNVFGSSFISV